MRIIILLMLVIQGCNQVNVEEKPSKYSFDCSTNLYKRYHLERCENTEAVCYVRATGISCFKK